MKKIILGLCLVVLSLQARDVIDNQGTCQINWTKGHIRCEGESEVNQSKFAASIVAKIVARRNLLEVIKGVKIDSSVTVAEGLMSSELINSRVTGVIKGAQVVSNKYYKKEKYSKAVVQIEMGKDLLHALLSDPTKLSWNEKINNFFNNFSLITQAHASTYTYKEKDTLTKILKDLKKEGDSKGVKIIEARLKLIDETSYSGILIDISGISNFEKAMIVKLVDESGKEFYPAKKITKKVLMKKNTSVGYMFNFKEARADKRVFSTPLEIKVNKVYKNKKSNIVLTKNQIEKIKSLDKDIYANAKIILVLGD